MDRFRNVVEASPMGIHMYRLEKDGRLVFTGANQAADRILGVDHRRYVGKTVEEAFPPLVSTEIPERYRRAARLGESWQTRTVYEDNEIKGAYEFYAFQTSAGEMAALFLDITDRTRVEKDVQRLAAAVGQTTDGVLILSVARKIRYVNPAFERISGFRAQDLLNRGVEDLPLDSETRKVFPSIRRVIEKGRSWSGRFSGRRADGAAYDIELGLSPVRDAEGKTTDFIAVIHDITENLAMEERLRQAQKMEAIGHLAGGVAHDFNNLLAPILGYTQMLLMKLEEGHPFRADLQEIEKAAYRGRDLSRQLLTFSRKQVFEMQVTSLSEILSSFQKILRRTIREDIEILVDVKAKGHIHADESQIELILMNLAVNAQDAMPEGGRLLLETRDIVLDEAYVQAHPGTPTGPQVMLCVSDTGCGMDPEMMKHLFEPFYTTKDKDHGTGLGLASVYGIVKQHGGSIWIHSEKNAGSAFKVYFPRVDAESKTNPSELDRPNQGYRGTERVALCEDNPPVRKMVAKALRNLGYEVLVATSAKECLRLFEPAGNGIRLLVTDVIMPGMNGKDLYKRLGTRHPELKVLYMSGYTQNVIAQQGVLEKDERFLQKPFTLEDLSRKVRETIEG